MTNINIFRLSCQSNFTNFCQVSFANTVFWGKFIICAAQANKRGKQTGQTSWANKLGKLTRQTDCASRQTAHQNEENS